MTQISGDILFVCACTNTRPGRPEDTLMAEDVLGDKDLSQKYITTLDQMLVHPSRYDVKRDCVNCGMDYMTLVRIGPNMITQLRCTCGNQIPY